MNARLASLPLGKGAKAVGMEKSMILVFPKINSPPLNAEEDWERDEREREREGESREQDEGEP